MDVFDVSKNLRLTEYRKDIDGLRAIAIIAVIINHLNKNILENQVLGFCWQICTNGSILKGLNKTSKITLISIRLIHFQEHQARKKH